MASLRLHPSAFRSTHAFALHVWPFLTPEFQEAHPSTKSGSLDNKYEYHSTSQRFPKHSTKISCQCTNPFRHLVRATPKTTRKPFRGHGRRCWPRPPWHPQRSAARPRRHGLPQPQNAAASSLGRRGCNADGGAAAAAVEKQSV